MHFQITSRDSAASCRFYRELFGWQLAMTDDGEGFLDGSTTKDDAGNTGINGSIDNGAEPGVMFYVSVPDVEQALQRAERLGATRTKGPQGTPGELVTGQFVDLDGQVIGVAGTA
ncbi:MAG: glyoxalase [Streptosporangiales bacterium]|nr:glyoxalase [Streptosporangiales bacterium]